MAGLTSFVNVIDVRKHGGKMTNPENEGLEDLLYQMCQGTYNPMHLINTLDDSTPLVGAWTESASATFDVSSTAADNRIATNALLLTATAACDDTQYAELRYIDGGSMPARNLDTGIQGMNWEDTDYVGFWMSALAAGGFGTAGEMTFALVNHDGSNEEVGTHIDLPLATNAVHQRVELDIAGESRDNVVAVRFYCNNANAAEGIELDSMIRYKFGNGKGPAVGPIVILPIVSGQSVARGDIVSVEVSSPLAGMAVRQEAAADQVNDIGVVVVGGTGVAARNVYAAVQVGGLAYLRSNEANQVGEGLIWHSDNATYGHMIEGVANGEEEYSFARAYEAAGAQYDDILCWIVQSNVFVA